MSLRKHTNLFFEAAAAVLRNHSRSGVVLLCLIGVLLPFVTAMAVSEGVRQQAMISVESGADLYISREQYGQNGPVSLSLISELQKYPGVIKVVPRIVGRTYMGEELAVVVGIDNPDQLNPDSEIKPPSSSQALIGQSLADRLDLKKGDEVRFFINPTIPFNISEIIGPEHSMWSGSMVVIPFKDAEQIFKLPGKASELLLYCRPGTAEHIAERLGSLNRVWQPTPPLRIQTKDIVRRYVGRGFTVQSGIFSMFYLTAFGLAIPAILILSGLGHGTRSKEIGIMKATGWQTLEVLEMTAFENLLLALSGSLLTLILAMVWLKIGNGIGIAPLFISGVGWVPEILIPSSFMPMPALFSFLFGFILTMVGTIIPTWKTAIIPPRNAIQ